MTAPAAPTVVSLIASGTEIVAALGMLDQLVGVSHECDFPPQVTRLPALCSAKMDPSLPSARIDRDVRALVADGLSVYRVDVAALRELRPDVIVTQDHCEVCAVSLSDVEDALCQLDLPGTRVCSLHPRTLDDVRADFRKVAEALGIPDRGEALVAELDGRLQAIADRIPHGVPRPRVALVEWLAPPMVAGGWMPQLAQVAGADPVIVDTPDHFAEVRWEEVARADPELVVVLPCGFDVPRSLAEMEDEAVRAGLLSVPAVAQGRCVVVDGNAYFNRPGPRLADSAEILAALFHPELFPDFVERYAPVITSWAGAVAAR